MQIKSVLASVLLLGGLNLLGCGPTSNVNENDNIVDNQNENENENENANENENTNENENENENINENENVDLNEAPVADAGDDQSVAGGTTVTLDGSGSSDADGDTLTFSWVQTSGTEVTLSDTSSGTPTFPAPNETTTLVFQLTVNDGTEDSAPDFVNISVTEQVTPVLFIANFVGANVTSYANPSSVNGNIAPEANLAGASTGLSSPSDIVVTADEVLISSNFATDSLTSYVDAASANGNLEPDGNVQGASTQLNDPTTLAVNTAEDLVFVANIATDIITIYESASESSFNGNLPPIRTIATTTTGELNNPFGINFGSDDDLYVANNGGANILVFAGASNLNGDVSPTRIITSTDFNSIFDVFIDADDTMYVVDSTDDEVYIFNDASSLNGAVTPDFTLTVSGAGTLTAIAVDSNGVGYIVDNALSAIYSYDDIATQNGTLTPDRTIQGLQTQLDGPIRVFLVE